MTRRHAKKSSSSIEQEVKDSPGAVVQGGMGNQSLRMEATNYKGIQVIQYILVHSKPEIKERLKRALATYLMTLKNDKNRIPLECILDSKDFFPYETVPLPAVFTKLDVLYELPNKLPASQQDVGEESHEQGDHEEAAPPGNTPIAAVQAVAENRHIVIVGDPGAGKTTLINYLCSIMARMLLEGNQKQQASEWRSEEDNVTWEERLDGDSNGAWKASDIVFPISIRLRDFGRSEQFKRGRGDTADLAEYLADVVVGEFKKTAVAQNIRDYVLDLLREGGALILMDGLDELPGETDGETALVRKRLKEILNSFTTHPQYGKCRVVVTSRSYAYKTGAKWHLGSHFAEARLREFEPEQIQQYITYWHKQAAMLRQRQTPGSLAGPNADDTIEATVSSFWHALEKNQPMLKLARSPLILTFIVIRYGMHKGFKSLPSVSKVNLYEEIVSMLTTSWSQQRDELSDLIADLHLREGQLKSLLSVVAFEAHRGMEDDQETSNARITSETLKQAWKKIIGGGEIIQGEDGQNVWRQLRDRTGILLPDHTADDRTEYFTFAHQSLQEWLAAKAIMSKEPQYLPIEYWPDEYRRDAENLNLPDLVAGLIKLTHERWQEVIALILESTIESEPSTTWGIIKRLVSGAFPETPEDSRWYGALLAAEFLERNNDFPSVHDPRRSSERAAVKKWLVRALHVQAMSIQDRVESGRILSVLGDDRVQLGGNNGLLFNEAIWHPHHANAEENLWVRVPATTILLGSPPQDSEGRKRDKERRPPNCKREVQGFLISRYPITSDMFQCFVEDGYSTEECWKWSTSSLQWHEHHPTPHQSDQTRLGNAPCRMVSWYEAVAFCQWLTLKNPFNLEIFLPGESEWLAAARSDSNGTFQDTVYLWGDALESGSANLNCYGNVRRLKLNAICSVGIFQPNTLGLFDMSGNVAEWTRSMWRPNLATPENNRLDADPRILRTVRGCSYREFDAEIRVGHRMERSPEGRYSDIGFRIAARLPN